VKPASVPTERKRLNSPFGLKFDPGSCGEEISRKRVSPLQLTEVAIWQPGWYRGEILRP